MRMNTWGQGSQASKKQIAIQRSKKLKQRKSQIYTFNSTICWIIYGWMQLVGKTITMIIIIVLDVATNLFSTPLFSFQIINFKIKMHSSHGSTNHQNFSFHPSSQKFKTKIQVNSDQLVEVSKSIILSILSWIGFKNSLNSEYE